MSRLFVTCKGKTACVENETECRTCGRSLDEIYGTRALIDELAEFVEKMGYANSDMFLEYVANKAAKKIRFKQQEAGMITTVSHEYH